MVLSLSIGRGKNVTIFCSIQICLFTIELIPINPVEADDFGLKERY